MMLRGTRGKNLNPTYSGLLNVGIDRKFDIGLQILIFIFSHLQYLLNNWKMKNGCISYRGSGRRRTDND